MLGSKITVHGLLALAVLGCSAEVLWGQFGMASRQPSTPVISSIRTSMASTVAGEPVASWTVDPFMTDEQERSIHRWLQTPCPFEWDEGTTLQDLQRDLATGVPTILDHQGIEEIGLEQEVVLVPVSKRHRQTSRPAAVDPFNAAAVAKDPFDAAPASDNPFADDPFAAELNRSATASTPVEPKPKPQPQVKQAVAEAAVAVAAPPWWRRPHGSSGAASDGSAARLTPSVGARVAILLGQVDLTVSMRGGQLILTTQQRAEAQLCNRVYDVTPLLDPQRADARTLMQTIETAVEPDTWESLGGPSTISVFPSRQRQWLVVSAPTTVHWKVQSLLDRLNQ